MSAKRIAVCGVVFLLCGHVYATEHWSGEVSKITIFENKSAFIIVSNPRNGPSGAFGCTQNVVYLGVKNAPVSKEFLSQVMMAYAAEKTIRFGIRGSGDSCETEYITAE